MKVQEDIKTFDQLIDSEHGTVGTDSRNAYEENTHHFIISEMLKEALREANYHHIKNLCMIMLSCKEN